jgi:protein SCO1/2
MLAFLSPEGVITRYSLAVAFEPSDLKKALVEAGDGTVGSPVDQLILWCFSYDPTSNSYVPQAWRIMRLAGAATVGLMLACLAPYWIGRKRLSSPDSDKLTQPEST